MNVPGPAPLPACKHGRTDFENCLECIADRAKIREAVKPLEDEFWQSRGERSLVSLLIRACRMGQAASGNSGGNEGIKDYYLVIGPIENNLDGFSAEDRKEWLEDAGWKDVKIQRIEDKATSDAITLGEQPFGTSHWAGTWKGCPALSLGYHGGATLFYFDGEWKKQKFDDLASLHAAIGVNR